MYRNELTVFEQEILDFYKSLNPAEVFPFMKSPAEDRTEYVGGSNVSRKPSGKPPVEFRLTETYVDLGLAIQNRNWVQAETLYYYLRRVTGFA